MITYIILLLIIVAISISAYFLFEKDILRPTVISSSMFGLSIVLAIIGKGSWNRVESINLTTILIIVLGLLSFFVGEFLAQKTKIADKFFNKINLKNKYKEEKQNNIILIFVCLFFIILTTALLLIEIIKICNYYGFFSNNISNLLGFYRTKTELFSTSLSENGIGINFIIKQMKKICDVINILFAFMLIRKIVNKQLKEKIVETIALVCGICFGLFQTLLNSGGRSIMMHYFVAYIILYILMVRKKEKNNIRNIKFKNVIKISIAISIISVIFYTILPILGRSSNANFIEYISFYLGSPIPSLSVFVEKNIGINPQFASETFSGIYYILNKFGIINYNQPLTHEWISFVPGLASNVYTSLRSYYFDFGILGVIIFQFIFGYIYTKFYIKAKNSDKSLIAIIYSFYAYILIDQIRAEQFYSLINTANIAFIILLIIMYKILICDLIKKGMSDIFETINKKVSK